MKPITKLIALTFLLCSTVGILCTATYAEIPRQLTYQGKLTDKTGNPIDQQTVSVTFRIYDSLSKPIEQALWSETQSVTPKKGMFNVVLGQTTPINLTFDTQHYIGMQVASDPEMSPRLSLASVGYALNSERLGGKSVTEFSLSNHTHDASNITGTLPVANGGTGITTSLIKVGTYVGNGVPGKTIAHGLGATPVIVMIVEDTTNACILYVNGMATYTNAGGIVSMTVDATNLTLNMGNVMGNGNGKTYYFTAIRAN